jgi:predicted TIM-barrel fold metal-dependent hydrolase
MRVVALEEHIAFGSFASGGGRGAGPLQKYLEDVDNERLASMDAAGITMQVLSVPIPGAAMIAPDEAASFARRYNDAVAAAARRHPGRFSAFAHLPLMVPEAAADELERGVRELGSAGALISGTTHGKFLDDPTFDPILARAEALDVPIYIHPGVPPPSVCDAYYGGFSPDLSAAFATTGWGWHAETAVHVLRMVLAGTLDKHPRLRLIVGHMGEGLPTMLDRCDERLSPKAKHLTRSVAQSILDQVTITTSGFFTLAPFLAALLTFGADRIMFSVDYPFSENEAAGAFLNALPVSPDDKKKIAHGNADRLLKLS